jgi:hypothetical protein
MWKEASSEPALENGMEFAFAAFSPVHGTKAI